MQEFKQKFKFLVLDKFNLNIFGPNGCGKTNLAIDALNEIGIIYMKIDLSDFVNVEVVYSKFKNFLIQILTSLNNNSLDEDTALDISNLINFILDIQIKKFLEIHEEIENFFSILEAGISNSNNINKKYFDKNVYVIIDGFEDINLISTNKKFCKYLTSLISICENFFIGVILISNYIFTTSENNKSFLDTSHYIPLPFPKLNFQQRKDFLINYFEADDLMTNDKRVDECLNIALGNYQTNIINSNKYISYTKDILDICRYDINFLGNQSKIKRKIRTQVAGDIFINQTYTRDNMIRYSSYESLSINQKILLISALLAKETNNKYDLNLFKAVKSKKDYAMEKNIKHKPCFNIHRLFGIFSSLYSIIYNKTFISLNIDFISDFNNLVKDNYLRYTENNVELSYGINFNRKLICNVSFELVERFAREFDIYLTDFLDLN